jgi:hypothetical protein
MSTEYIITKLTRLIDLNNNMVNFKLRFTVTAIDDPNTSFQCVVLDQETMDSIDESSIEFRNVTGSLSGEIISDKNIYKNYMLLLRADVPTNVRVDLSLEEIPSAIVPKDVEKPKESNSSLTFLKENKQIIMVVLFLIVAAILYMKKENLSLPGSLGSAATKLSLLDKLKNVANTAT